MPALFEALPKEFVSGTSFYDYKTPVTEALEKVKKFGAVVVLKGKEYYGIVDDRSLFRTRTLKPLSFSKRFPVGKFARKLPILDSATSLGVLIKSFHDFGTKALPYQDGKRITGIVRRDVVVSTILSLHMLSKSRVADIMSSPVISIDAESNVARAVGEMEKSKIARLVVMDSRNRLAGLIALRDVADRFAKPQERLPERKTDIFSPSNVSVASVMRTPVYTIDSGMPAEDAARKMLENKVSSLVVTRGAAPVGIVSARDIIENAAASTAKTQSRIIISGLDEYTREYEQPLRDAIDKMISKADRFERTSVDYVSVNVERHRERNYELHARLALRGKGVVFAHSTGYSLESTLNSLLNSIYKRIRSRKESFLSKRKLAERHYDE